MSDETRTMFGLPRVPCNDSAPHDWHSDGRRFCPGVVDPWAQALANSAAIVREVQGRPPVNPADDIAAFAAAQAAPRGHERDDSPPEDVIERYHESRGHPIAYGRPLDMH